MFWNMEEYYIPDKGADRKCSKAKTSLGKHIVGQKENIDNMNYIKMQWRITYKQYLCENKSFIFNFA